MMLFSSFLLPTKFISRWWSAGPEEHKETGTGGQYRGHWCREVQVWKAPHLDRRHKEPHSFTDANTNVSEHKSLSFQSERVSCTSYRALFTHRWRHWVDTDPKELQSIHSTLKQIRQKEVSFTDAARSRKRSNWHKRGVPEHSHEQIVVH